MITTRRSARPACSVAALVGTGLVLVACGSDGGDAGGTSVEEFCAEVTALEAAASDDDELDQAAVDQFVALAERAPDEIRDSLDVMATAMQQAIELDEEDFDGFFEIFFAPEVVAAGEELDRFSVEECGLEPSDSGDDSIDLGEIEVDEGDDAAAGDVPDLSGVESPLWDDFMDEVPDPNVASLDGLKLYFDTEWSDASWRLSLSEGANSFGQFGNEWSIAGTNLLDFGIEICQAAAGYLRDLEPDAEIVINELDPDSFEETLIASGNAAGECS